MPQSDQPRVDGLALLVEATLDGAPRPVLVVTDLDLGLDLVDVEVRTPADPKFIGHRSVLVVAADVADLRRTVSRTTRIGRTRWVGCVVARADAALPLRAHPSWPAVVGLDAHLDGASAVTVVELADRVTADKVLMAIGRAAAAPVPAGPAGVRIALGAGSAAPPVDYTLRRGYDLAEDRPPDVLIGIDDEPVFNEVIQRAPTVVTVTDDLHVGPVDEAVFNPRTFRRDASDAVVTLDPQDELTPALAASLRAVVGVRVGWPVDERVVAGLAMCGLPLVAEEVPDQARARLGDHLSDLLTESVDLTDPSARERHSVRLRRAALVAHGVPAWRGRLAALAGVRHAGYPSVSVVAPDPAQLATQRQLLPGADVEVVPTYAAATNDLVLVLDADVAGGPDLVTDLLLARRYSGADVVGVSDEHPETYGHAAGLALLDRRLGRGAPDELFRAVVDAGGLGYRTHAHSLGEEEPADG